METYISVLSWTVAFDAVSLTEVVFVAEAGPVTAGESETARGACARSSAPRPAPTPAAELPTRRTTRRAADNRIPSRECADKKILSIRR
jgi:hypothetical protein